LTETVGATWTISPTIVSDFRFNFSRTDNYTSTASTDYGGATPLNSFPYPSEYTLKNSGIYFYIASLQPIGASSPVEGTSPAQLVPPPIGSAIALSDATTSTRHV